ncbi:hypothetical protein Tco_1501303 [Tanacetum coccineum]
MKTNQDATLGGEVVKIVWGCVADSRVGWVRCDDDDAIGDEDDNDGGKIGLAWNFKGGDGGDEMNVDDGRVVAMAGMWWGGSSALRREIASPSIVSLSRHTSDDLFNYFSKSMKIHEPGHLLIIPIEAKRTCTGSEERFLSNVGVVPDVDDGSFFIGLQISQSPRGIFLNQSKYAIELIKKYGMETCELVDTLMVEKSKLDKDPQGNAVDPTGYRGMIGTLMYLTASRLDLVFVLCMCSRYQAKPTKKHLHAVKRIFRYLRGTINTGLWYPKDSCIALTAFVDADHAGCQDTRKSTSGMENGVVELYFVRTEYQLTDIFTKPLAQERLEFLIKKLGMQSMSPKTLKKLADGEEE